MQSQYNNRGRRNTQALLVNLELCRKAGRESIRRHRRTLAEAQRKSTNTTPAESQLETLRSVLAAQHAFNNKGGGAAGPSHLGVDQVPVKKMLVPLGRGEVPLPLGRGEVPELMAIEEGDTEDHVFSGSESDLLKPSALGSTDDTQQYLTVSNGTQQPVNGCDTSGQPTMVSDKSLPPTMDGPQQPTMDHESQPQYNTTTNTNSTVVLEMVNDLNPQIQDMYKRERIMLMNRIVDKLQQVCCLLCDPEMLVPLLVAFSRFASNRYKCEIAASGG
eukprot:sb/3468082/